MTAIKKTDQIKIQLFRTLKRIALKSYINELDNDLDRLQNVNLHFHIDFLSCNQQDTVFDLTADHHMINSFCNVNISKDLILHILTNVSKFRKLS